jgi:signal transduction histidine kinase
MEAHQIEAASMQVSISSYVGTATLAVLAGAVALFTYISQQFEPKCGFYVLMIIGAVALVFSLFLGGKGSAAVASHVNSNSWSTSTKVDEFGGQALLALIGVFAVLAATAVGLASPRQDNSLEARVERLAENVAVLEAELTAPR